MFLDEGIVVFRIGVKWLNKIRTEEHGGTSEGRNSQHYEEPGYSRPVVFGFQALDMRLAVWRERFD